MIDVRRVSAKTKPAIEVHKFGGASLDGGAAFARAIQIILGRTGPRVVVVSAPAGVTDALLALATRAVAGGGESADVEPLRKRYKDILAEVARMSL